MTPETFTDDVEENYDPAETGKGCLVTNEPEE